MSMRKKIVWLPYDFDTALGINNEGALVFGYNLEDIDHTESDADIYNGQDSVMWVNMRAAFFDQIRTMYQNLRSTGALSYSKVEEMFETHQHKWGESIFNEDAWFKYLQPLIDDNDGSYLAMLQGSKEEQRKWWMYNRFRYMDSKYNAGDAQSDVIQLRGYAKSNVTVTPYADVYASVKFGSYLQQTRATRGQSYEIVCPLDVVNDTEIYIYSASQLSSVGDLSGLKVGYADFSKATKLSSIKLGDSAASYSNGNLKELYVGNNTLLRTLDVRNCNGLGTGDMKSVDISGCTNIENVYFSGTNVTGVDLPNGGILKTLTLPSTVTNLTVRNQPGLTTFSMPSYSNITTLRLENNSTVIPVETILGSIAANSRVRILGLDITVSSTTEVDNFYAFLDTMRGMDENGNNLPHAVVSGRIRGLHGVNRSWYMEKMAQYPDVAIDHDYLTVSLTYCNYDGTQVYEVQDLAPGDDGTYDGRPPRASSAQYTYTFVGWSLSKNATSADSGATENVTVDRTVYAAYAEFLRTYTVTWANDDGSILEVDPGVIYGTTPTYNGNTPTSTVNPAMTFFGWLPAIHPVDADITYTPDYAMAYRVRFYNGTTLLQTINQVRAGTTAEYTGATPVSPDDGFVFDGWLPSNENIQAATDCYAQFRDTNTPLRQYLAKTLHNYTSTGATKVGVRAFSNHTNLETVETTATLVDTAAFLQATALTVADFTGSTGITLRSQAFSGCRSFEHLILRGASVGTMADVAVLNQTPISFGLGTIYVPSELLASYKTATNWSRYADQIYPLSAYPRTSFETISDSWVTILSNPNYATDYAIGDTKALTIGDQVIYMEIAAFDADPLASGNGTAAITWIANQGLERHRMDDQASTADGWGSCEMRTYLRDTVYPTIPQEVRSHIVEVTKTYRTITPSDTTLSIGDTIWLPSAREVASWTGSTTPKESSGPTYSRYAANAATLIKCATSPYVQSITWWTRSAVNSGSYGQIGNSGGYTNSSAMTQGWFVFGFCTNP